MSGTGSRARGHRIRTIEGLGGAEKLHPMQAAFIAIDVTVVDHPDFAFNPLGIRGIGEIGITGVPAALSNAIHHATGRRLRELPMTLDKLL